ncbi:MAG TPA: hypothetical protein VL137_16545 [Polyangiaceae bacterium]|nr:hypothetical protein [Polyangiaceae bacterium]
MRILAGPLLIFGALFVLVGCASSPLERRANARDWPGLEHAIAQAEAEGKWSSSDARDLAHEILAADLKEPAKAQANGWVAELQQCSSDLLSELKSRSKVNDEVGAASMRILEEIDQVSFAPLVEKYAGSDDPRWRAVGLRAAVESSDTSRLLRGFVDGDVGVRRAALGAARMSAGSIDIAALLNAANHDPDALNRSLAARVETARGGERAVLFLRDYWASVTPAERVAFVEAWAEPAALGAGGERELVWVIETQHGMAQISAAAVLQRHSQTARGVLLSAVRDGALEEQRLAAQLISLEQSDVVPTLKQVAESGADPGVRVVIWHRLATVAAEKKAAIAALRVLAQGQGREAQGARYALAAAGDPSVIPVLQTELTAQDPSTRLQSAFSLLALGQAPKAAHLLADRSTEVRRKVACMLLAPAHESR